MGSVVQNEECFETSHFGLSNKKAEDQSPSRRVLLLNCSSLFRSCMPLHLTFQATYTRLIRSKSHSSLWAFEAWIVQSQLALCAHRCQEKRFQVSSRDRAHSMSVCTLSQVASQQSKNTPLFQ